MKVTPQKLLAMTTEFIDNIEKAKRLKVAVGLPSEAVGGKVYGDGMTVIKNGAIHEYGNQKTPKRSFLQVPFMVKQKDMDNAIAGQFKAVFEKSMKADVALGRIGVIAVNVSKGAFTSKGYGQWPELNPDTVKRKGSSVPLIDTGILRSSITYVVR